MSSDHLSKRLARCLIPAVAALVLPACVLKANQGADVLTDEIECVVTGESHAGASIEEICELFRDAVSGLKRNDVARVDIAVASPTSANATAKDGDGNSLLKLGFSISDQTLMPAAWRDFASAFARELATLP